MTDSEIVGSSSAASWKACDALYEFASKNRPAPSGFTAIEGVLIDTYARSTKTYQAVVRLAYVGYGEQALMLGRPLFEDMVVGHWMHRNPESVQRLEHFRLASIERLRTNGKRLSNPDVIAQLPPPLPKDKREALRRTFSGKQHWTGLGLSDLVKAVEDEWPEDGNQRGLLWEIYEFDAFQANHLIHHGHVGLSSGRTDAPGKRSYNVGASPKFIHEALRLAFFSYANTLSLVLRESPEFDHLYDEHLLRSGFVKATRK
jgi:Family of unknown function (DUF5677)